MMISKLLDDYIDILELLYLTHTLEPIHAHATSPNFSLSTNELSQRRLKRPSISMTLYARYRFNAGVTRAYIRAHNLNNIYAT